MQIYINLETVSVPLCRGLNYETPFTSLTILWFFSILNTTTKLLLLKLLSFMAIPMVVRKADHIPIQMPGVLFHA